MTCDKILTDAEFGHLYIKTHARAVRYTFKPARDGSPQCGLLITVPVRYALQDVLSSVERNRPKLRQLIQSYHASLSQGSERTPLGRPAIDWDFQILSDSLHITVVRGTNAHFYLNHTPTTMQLICPPDTDFHAEGRQEWLAKVLTEGLRQHARSQLIPRVEEYAAEHGITLHDVKVNLSKSHWGSCAQHKAGSVLDRRGYYNINLSVFTLLLPLDLQRLILLHELMHTRHMDHSPAFHHELDQWLGGQEAALEARLKPYSTDLFSFVTPK